MRAFLAVVIFIALVLGGYSFYQQKQIDAAHAHRQAAIAEAEATKQEFLAKKEQHSSPTTPESSELLKLRGEVTRLRELANRAESLAQENARLKTEVQKLKSETAISQPEDATENYYGRDSWSFAGYNTPEAALISAIWSMKEGDPVTYLQSLSPDEQQRMAKVWENKSEVEVAAKHKNDVSAITGLRVLEQQTTPNGEMQMRVHIDGVNRTETVRMKFINNEWKFGGFIREQ